jgi:predicted RNase H-like HicB family nuclease
VVIEPPVVIEQTRTLEDVRALLKEVQDRKIDAKPLLLEYGATKLTEIPKDKYDEIYERGLKL